MNLTNLKPALTWIRSVYSENDGTGSSTRVHIGLLIAFILGVGVSFAVGVHHHQLSPEQFDAYLAAGGTFVVTCCGALYGINKLGSWAEGNKKQDADRTT